MQPAVPMPLPAPRQPRSQPFLSGWPGKQALRQRPQVKPCPTCDDRQRSPGLNFLDCRPRLSAVLPGSKWSVRCCHINEMMPHALPFRTRWFGRPQFHAAIDSNRVATNNLAVESLGQGKRQGRLPAPRRPQHDHHLRLGLLIRQAQGRHHPTGKIHAGLVRNSQKTRIAPATNTNPTAWFRLKARVCSARRSSSAFSSKYGLMRLSTTPPCSCQPDQ